MKTNHSLCTVCGREAYSNVRAMPSGIAHLECYLGAVDRLTRELEAEAEEMVASGDMERCGTNALGHTMYRFTAKGERMLEKDQVS